MSKERNNYFGMKDVQPSPLPKNVPLEVCATVGLKMSLAQFEEFLDEAEPFLEKAKASGHSEVSLTSFRKYGNLNVTSR